MKKGLFIFMFGIIFLSGFILATQPVPQAFEGYIIAKDGSLTSGKTLIARLDGTTTGQTIVQGNYFKITVVDYAGYGGEIKFYMGDEKAKESFEFEDFGIIKTNLTFDTIPDETIGSCGDGICAVEECSFCAIDCPVSKCNNNNVCDEAIGEDCLTAPQDCGECETEETPNNNNNNGNSGGGGGGGGGGSTPTTNLNAESDGNTQESNDEPLVLTIEELNQKENQKQGFFKATGSAISDFSKTTGGKISIIILVLAVLLIVGVLVKKKLKK